MFNVNIKMIMKTSDVLLRQNFITKVLFSDGDAKLSRELRVKIMAMRIEFGKIKKHFDEDVAEFVKDLVPQEFKDLQAKADKTEEENEQLKKEADQINTDYAAYVKTRGEEEVTVNHEFITEDEFNQIVEVNADNNVEINGQKINSGDFLEALYALFVQEEE